MDEDEDVQATQRARAAESRGRGRRKGEKRKGLRLTPEKKKLLKQLIMEKAAAEMREEAKRRAEEKERYVNSKVPSLGIDGLDKGGLERKIKELHRKLCELEEEKYDWEMKIRKQDFEINDLNVKVNDIKGKFVKPVLKKVSKTESKLAKLGKKDESSSFRNMELKSTGKQKYTIDKKEGEEEPKTPDFRSSLKKGDEGGESAEAPADAEEVAAEEDE